MQTVIKKVTSISEIEETWCALQGTTNCGPFISWMWICPWLENMEANGQSVFLVEVRDDENVVGLGLLYIATLKRRVVFERDVVFLNEFPVEDYNMVIEYNGLLVKKEFLDEAWRSFLSEMKALPHWDELHLNAISPLAAPSIRRALQFHSQNLDCLLHSSQNVFFACLKNIGAWKEAQSLLLSKNKRAQVNRSMRSYRAKYGDELRCEVAKNTTEALHFFEELEKLHTMYWQGRNETGAFANRQWVDFNRVIIQRSMSSNNVHLYRISVGEHVIGYLYNLVWEDTTYNIQSGFNYEKDNRLKPGFVSHWLAMEDSFNRSITQYNFLAGSTHYKKSLSNHSEKIEYFVIRKKADRIKFLLEDTLVGVVRTLRRLRR